jgi:hypothetical protein
MVRNAVFICILLNSGTILIGSGKVTLSFVDLRQPENLPWVCSFYNTSANDFSVTLDKGKEQKLLAFPAYHSI